MTKQDLLLRIATLEGQISIRNEREARLRRLVLLRALMNRERGGAAVHTANAYEMVARCIIDPREVDSKLEQTGREIMGRGLRRQAVTV